jgi:putative transposase
MIDRDHKLSVKRQASLLGISRGSVYYLPREVPETDLALMRRVDELHLDYPFAGSRMLRDLLAGEGLRVGRLHVSTLMKRMGIEALYRKPNTSKPEPGHKIYPYLLRKLAVTRPRPKSGRSTSPTCPWPKALYTSSPSSTGSVAGCLPGGCR